MKAPPCFRFYRAFTLLELMVVVAIIAVLASLLLGALSLAKARAQGVVCWGNLQQLQLAWHLYAYDCEERLPPNYLSELAGHDPRFPCWVASYIAYGPIPDHPYLQDPRYFGDLTNAQSLLAPGVGRIGPYIRAAGSFKCPGDKSSVVIGQTRYLRPRTYCMNMYMGGDKLASDPDIYFIFTNRTKILKPSPSLAWVFIDVHEDSISDPMFMLTPEDQYFQATAWSQFPASRHNGLGVISFADGHAEFRKWVDPRTRLKVTGVPRGEWQPNNRDVIWLQERTTSRGPRWIPW